VGGIDAETQQATPLPTAELVARVRALLRRGPQAAPAVLRVADLTLDPARRVVTRGGQRIELTAREFALLDCFMRNPGRVLTRTAILEHVWNYDFDPGSNVVDVYVNYLRRKIDEGRDPKLIRTVRGAGYMLGGN